ncbi:hypothetical protein E4U36_004877 [Claviceps purpurea]|nr:hypothetical protein E4U36_004877 [Claviceps purpurea]
MAHQPPQRSRAPYDDFGGYYPPPPHDAYHGPQPSRRHKSERRPSTAHDAYDAYDGPQSPRRHTSERRPRRHSPDVAPQVDEYVPRRGHSRREPPNALGMSKPAASGRRARSPPPYYAPEPLSREPRRESWHEDARREPRHSRHESDPRRAYGYDNGGYKPVPKEKHHRRSHHEEPEYRPRRDHMDPPADYTRHRPRDRDDAGYRPRTAGPLSPDQRHRARDSVPSTSFGSEEEVLRRRARSHDRAKSRDVYPPRGRDHDMPPHSSKPSSSARRKSAPAPPLASTPKTPKKQWWQNPYVQAGARTAFTAGAQAVMQNRHDPSPWLGAKGAKVATAALGAALMDGLGGKKQNQKRR